MIRWLTSLRDRPIAESERTGAMASVTVLMLTAAILLVLSRPENQSQRSSPPRSSPSVVQTTSASYARGSDSGTTPLTPELVRAADLFLAGYLGYLYGHASASQVKGATPALLHALRTHPPRVSPSMRARTPRIVALHSTPAPSGLLGISAKVNDGDLIDYSIGLLLASHDSQLLVSSLGGSE
jgi:hypothetical protein